MHRFQEGMAPYKSMGFGDDRRVQADAHKPRGCTHRSERSDGSERDRISAWRASSDVREGENYRGFRDDRNSRDTTKEMSQNRSALKVKTDIPTAHRAQISPHKDSPTGGRPSTGTVNLSTTKIVPLLRIRGFAGLGGRLTGSQRNPH